MGAEKGAARMPHYTLKEDMCCEATFVSLSESSQILHDLNPKEAVFSLIQAHFKEAAHIPPSLNSMFCIHHF